MMAAASAASPWARALLALAALADAGSDESGNAFAALALASAAAASAENGLSSTAATSAARAASSGDAHPKSSHLRRRCACSTWHTHTVGVAQIVVHRPPTGDRAGEGLGHIRARAAARAPRRALTRPTPPKHTARHTRHGPCH